MPFLGTSGKCSQCFNNEYKCVYCPGLSFHNSYKLIDHLQNSDKHKDDNNSVFRCSICNDRSFSSKAAYVHHLEQKTIHKYDLHQAACCGKYEDLERLIRCENLNVTGISHKINPNTKVNHHVGSTPMHCAAFNGYSRCLKVMLSWPECNSNVQDQIDGRTPVHVAAACGKASSLKELLKKGGRLDVRDKDGKTPLELAAGSLECIVVIVHYLRHCMQVSTYRDDSPTEMLDELVKLLEEFLNQCVSTNSDECTQTSAELQITKVPNPLPTDLLPYEVLARGEKCIEAFKRAMTEGKAPASRMKLIVVGEVDAGKTSLTRSLSGEPFQQTREKTHGIQTSEVSEMMNCTELNCSWKVADPQDSHVDQVIANFLCQHLDVKDLPDMSMLMRLPSSPATPTLSLGSLPPPQCLISGNEIVRSPTIKLDHYPGLTGLNTESGIASRVLVTEEKFAVEGTPRKLPASLVAQALLHKDEARASVKVNIWDFAGHRLYETMHHVFLNSRSLYLVVFSLLKMVRAEEDCLAAIHYWLNSIAVHTSSSTPVFLVGTHKAAVNEKQVRHANELVTGHFDDAFGTRIVRKTTNEFVFPVENSLGQEDEGVSRLIAAIKNESSSLSFVTEELPVKWLHCEEEILTYRQKPDREKCLTIDQLRKLLDEECQVKFSDEVEFRLMLNFFHDSGLILLPDNMCKEYPKSRINNLVILSPQYLVDIMTHIHDAPKRHAMNRQFSQELKKLEKEGKACAQLLEHVWKGQEKPYEVLVELLGHFNLMYPLHADNQLDIHNQIARETPTDISAVSGSSTPLLPSPSACSSPQPFSSPQKCSSSPLCSSPCESLFPDYIIPCLLKGKSGESISKQWSKVCQKQSQTFQEERAFVFDFGRFLPVALFNYLLVRMYQRCCETKGMAPILRRNGGIFSISNKFLFRIELILKNSQIWVYVRCRNGGRFLDFVKLLVQVVEEICQQCFRFLKFVYGPPCPLEHCPGACADVKAIQRPPDSSSSDSQESSTEETDKGDDSTSCNCRKLTGRRVHVLPMNQYEPPYWCQRKEIDEELLEDWRPRTPVELNESFDDVDFTDSGPCCAKQCCILLIDKYLGGDQWKLLGRQLSIDESKLENIDSEETKQEERCHQVLLSWQRSQGEDADLEILIKALGGIGREDVAASVRKHKSEEHSSERI